MEEEYSVKITKGDICHRLLYCGKITKGDICHHLLYFGKEYAFEKAEIVFVKFRYENYHHML